MKKIDDNDNVIMLMKQLELENGYIFDAPQPEYSESEEWHHKVNIR